MVKDNTPNRSLRQCKEDQTTIKKAVAGRIFAGRKLKGFTQEALARHVGVTAQQITKYENARSRIPHAVLFEISQLIGVPLNYFYQDIDLKLASTPPRSLSALEREFARLGARVPPEVARQTLAILRAAVAPEKAPSKKDH